MLSFMFRFFPPKYLYKSKSRKSKVSENEVTVLRKALNVIHQDHSNAANTEIVHMGTLINAVWCFILTTIVTC